MITRRGLLSSLALSGLAPALAPTVASTVAAPFAASRASAAEVEPPILTEDGLYRQPWFLESFLELGYDLEASASEGKRLAVMWELKGCPYCKETHFVNFADPEINGFVRSNFDILQLNIIGSRTVLDFDGEELSEKRLAQKYGVRFTPSFQFFPMSAEGLGELPPREREVARLQGYMKPEHFLAMFRYVESSAYDGQTFREYLRQQV